MTPGGSDISISSRALGDSVAVEGCDSCAEPIMHRDQKVGLSLAILLVGAVAAFFFRNERLHLPETPQLQEPELLNRQIAERTKKPYLDDGPRERREPVAEKRTLAQAPTTTIASGVSPELAQVAGNLPGFLKPNSRTPAPDPIAPVESAADGLAGSAVVPVPPEREVGGTLPFLTGEGKKSERAGPGADRPGRGAGADALNAIEHGNSAESGEYHIVQRGETLSSIAHARLGNAIHFGELLQANRDQLTIPKDLQVGMRLRLPNLAARNDSNGRRSLPGSTTGSGAMAAAPRSEPAARSRSAAVARSEEPASHDGEPNSRLPDPLPPRSSGRGAPGSRRNTDDDATTSGELLAHDDPPSSTDPPPVQPPASRPRLFVPFRRPSLAARNDGASESRGEPGRRLSTAPPDDAMRR